MTPQEILAIEQDIVEKLRGIFDPEIPVNIYDLGLIYDIEVERDGVTNITMTLTAANCPMADELLLEVNNSIATVEGVTKVNVNLVFEPQWDRNMISDEALFELGLL